MTSKDVFRQVDRTISRHERVILNQYRIALNETRAKLAEVYEKYARGGVLDYVEMAKYNRLASLESEIMKEFNRQNITVQADLKRIPEELYRESFYRHAYIMDTRLGTRLNWGRIPKDAVNSIVENPLAQIARGALTKNQKDRITRTLTQGFIQGKSYQNMADDIKQVYGKTTYEAFRVARTEGQKAAAAGQRACYDRAESLGIKTRLFWVAANQPRTRDAHAQMDGQEAVERDGALLFDYTGEKGGTYWITGPMDAILPAEDVINCRCRLREELAELPAGIKADHAQQSYLNWSIERIPQRSK